MNDLEKLCRIEAALAEQIRLANGQGKDTARATERLSWLRKQIATDTEWLGNVAALYTDIALQDPTPDLPWETRHGLQVAGEMKIPFAGIPLSIEEDPRD